MASIASESVTMRVFSASGISATSCGEKGGRGVVAGHIRRGDMPDHDGVQAGVRRKGQQLAGLQLVERL